MLICLIPLFWAFQPFWVEFVCLGPPGVEQTKLCIEPIHVPHVEEVICVADTKVPDQHLLFRQVCEISVTLTIVKVFKPAQAVWVSADTEKVLHAREISNACKYWSLIFQMLPSRLSGYFESNHIQLKFWGMPSSHFDFLNSSHPYCGLLFLIPVATWSDHGIACRQRHINYLWWFADSTLQGFLPLFWMTSLLS